MAIRSLFAILLLLWAPAVWSAAEPVEKINVNLGSWKGPSAGVFKSALRRGLQKGCKECKFSGAKQARVIIDGNVEEEGKSFSVTVVVKSKKSGEVVEQRSYKFGKRPSDGQASRMGREVAEIVRRSPPE
jgi:hypothetical protein